MMANLRARQTAILRRYPELVTADTPDDTLLDHLGDRLTRAALSIRINVNQGES